MHLKSLILETIQSTHEHLHKLTDGKSNDYVDSQTTNGSTTHLWDDSTHDGENGVAGVHINSSGQTHVFHVKPPEQHEDDLENDHDGAYVFDDFSKQNKHIPKDTQTIIKSHIEKMYYG